jgi:dihydroxy-acid dehydratase
MLYATEGIETDADLNKAMVGVASVWYVARLLCRMS